MIAFTVGLLLYAACGITVLKVINEVQGKPYMDEIFHIPQAQQYCHGNLSEVRPELTLSIQHRLRYNSTETAPINTSKRLQNFL